ncbi:uncharacterized protein KY384_000993 [Bacidia gigantensis]|uniref:uncharacterized protein n=1 Tax=Bacidia gigantensis TaxID=2732470 RepID=UPI001D03C75F|nr:uncharacterized protein KY384_000993 [Bacidia gigantensis]KAG8534149.1 hypothetical protein KY384_000993 [Bacidia gigantensis]
MASLSSLLNPAPWHIISYSTLLGTTLYQSFLVGPISYTALPRPQFSTLQTKIFPPFFAVQTVLPILIALTYPASSAGAHLSPLGASPPQSSFSGVFQSGNRMTVLVPIAAMFLTGLANLVVLGPATTKVMKERKHQETRDGKKYYESGEHSKDMRGLNKRFGILHGASSLVNLVGCGGMLWYGILLAERLA